MSTSPPSQATPPMPEEEMEKLLKQWELDLEMGSEFSTFDPPVECGEIRKLISCIRTLRTERDKLRSDLQKAVEELEDANSIICSEYCSRDGEHHWRCDRSRKFLSSLQTTVPPKEGHE